jgi:ABC-type multidrug transport system fused ATPase/permease subunit
VSNFVRALRAPRTAAVTPHPREESDFRRLIRLLGRFLVGQRRSFILAGLLLIAEAMTAVLPKPLVGYLVDYLAARVRSLTVAGAAPPPSPLMMLGLPGIINPDVDTVLLITVALIALTAVNSLADSLAEIYLARGGRMLGFNLRVALYSHLQRLSLAFHNQRRTGDILTRVTGDVTALEDFVTASLSDIVGSLLLIAFSLYIIVNNAWQVGIVALLIIPIMALISNYFSRRIKAASKKQRAREGDLASAAQEMLASIRVIQAYGRGTDEQQRFAAQSQKTMEAALEAAGLQARFSWVVSLLESVAVAAVIWLAVLLIVQVPPVVTVGALVVMIGLMQDMFKPTKKIIKEWNTVGKIYASVERIGELLDRKPAVQDAPDAIAAPPLRGDIEFRHVGFAYQPEPEDAPPGAETAPPRMTLRDVNFRAEPGEVFALVGPTGAGKSTILQLLPRLYDPHTGQVLIDGHDLREFTLESLRGQMSMVLQETILFTGSVADNIAYGRHRATREEVIAAAIQANAHEFIEKMPQGYDTLLSERAGNLSGGQRQRIAIARAFIRNTPILILDEPTTGLDAESTDLVRLALRTLMKGKTTLIISHDLNLIRQADQILVVKDGQIAEIGTHKELLQAEGVYAALYAMQFGQAMLEQGEPPAPPLPVAAAEDEPAPLTSRAFETLLMAALPEPVTPQAFEYLLTQSGQAQRAAESADGAQQPPGLGAGAGAAPEPPAVSARPPPGPGTPRPAIFRTMMMRVLPHPAPVDGDNGAALTGEEARMDDQAPQAAALPPLAEKTNQPATGRIAPLADRSRSDGDPRIVTAIGGASIDPLHSPALQRDLPGLPAAFDPEVMRAHLQAALFGGDRAAYTIGRITPGQAIYLVGECCVLRYALEITDRTTAQTLKPLVMGRVFPTPEAAARYKRDRLDPLVTLMRGREETAPFTAPVALIPPLNMVVYAFPIDGQLPTLIAATHRAGVVELLRDLLPEALDDGFVADDCRIELAHYGRMHRCVLRYHVAGRMAGQAAPVQRVIYGKVTDDGSGALTGPVIAALRERVRDSSSPARFNIPRALGYRPDLQLLLLEAIPGAPQVARLLGARLRGEAATAGTATLEDMHDACARIAATLHTAPIPLGHRRTLDDEVAVLREGFMNMRRISPELGALLQDQLERLTVYAEQINPLPLRFSHGDFTYTQLIFDGISSGLVDFDTVCQAEPALDLGQFLAYLRVAVQKAQRNAAVEPTALADELGTRFFNAYTEAASLESSDAEHLQARTAVYEIISLLRLALHSWQKLKAARIQNVLVVLEERASCLPQRNR